MLHRYLLTYLHIWKSKENRKPLVLRGARQVGKSWIVREFGRRDFGNFAELNLEDNPSDAEFITAISSPDEALRLLSARLKVEVTPGKTLLFIDEIQKSPAALAALRYWYEKFPSLHIIAAGSLLDFTLRQADFSMPVGRVEYCFMGPLSFSEFLHSQNEPELLSLLSNYRLGDQWPESIHMRLMRKLKEFWIVGGMPEAVANFSRTGSYATAEEAKRSIISTYADDFGKYGSKVDIDLVRKIYHKVPSLVGQRAKYVTFARDVTAKKVADALELLTRARVITRIRHTSGSGVPLAADADDTLAKHLFVDIGLQLSLCDLNPVQLEKAEDFTFINNGALAEQFVGQHLLFLRPPYYEPELYYWERRERNAAAELDYLIALDGRVVPLEVKSGAPGRMKSLQLFCEQRQSKFAVRFSGATPKRERLLNDTTLLSLPLYMVGEVQRLLREEHGW